VTYFCKFKVKRFFQTISISKTNFELIKISINWIRKMDFTLSFMTTIAKIKQPKYMNIFRSVVIVYQSYSIRKIRKNK